jgi:predicted nucleic acid-binding Zn ribbon protein
VVRTMPQRETDDEEGMDDRELPDRSDMDDDPEGPDTTDCPYCGKEIFADSEFCPHCAKYLSKEDTPLKTSTWVVIVVLALVGVILFGWVLR